MPEPGADLGEDLDAVVRRVDPDRWLASRFITDAQARADVIALYAFDHELVRAVAVTREPLMAEIRLTWWADAIAEIFEGRAVRRHPVTVGLEAAIKRHGLGRTDFDALLGSHFADPQDRPKAASSAMRIAATILGAPSAKVDAAALASAAHDASSLAEANRDLRGLPAQAFPAVSYATLARARGKGAISSRLRLLWATATGRL
ncbi:phytoene/squalene synthase family protein [soil metagenome]